MAGGSIRPENVQQIIEETGVPEIHSGLRHPLPSPVRQKVQGIHLGGRRAGEYGRSGVRKHDVESLRLRMEAAALETLPGRVPR
jgi:copper homeostasis protein CutC